jgi:hypothetical protein
MQIGSKNPLNPSHQFYKIMGPTRFERVTSRLSAVRSTWLSYGPDPQFALMIPLITVSLPSPKRGMLESVSLPPDQQILNAGDLTVRVREWQKTTTYWAKSIAEKINPLHLV